MLSLLETVLVLSKIHRTDEVRNQVRLTAHSSDLRSARPRCILVSDFLVLLVLFIFHTRGGVVRNNVV